MIKNYWKTALRNFWNNKTHGLLNVLGLATGIACAGLIFLWVENELNYDTFNVKRDRLYAVRVNFLYDSYIPTFSSTPGLLGPVMQAEIPGIVRTCRASENPANSLFTVGEKSVYAGGVYADSSLFNMFTLPFVQGNAKNAFTQLHSIVLTEKSAKKIFGNDPNIIGKTVRVDRMQDYTVTGVLRDLPRNSSLQFEWVAPFEVYLQQNPDLKMWGNYGVSTYVELAPSASLSSINKQMYDFFKRKDPKAITHGFLFPMKDWHLYSEFDNGKQTGGGAIEYVRLFSAIAWIVLFIACINFMNLSTARSEKRAREVGVRKVLGAGRRSLILQFIGEAFGMALLAAGIAVIVMYLMLPYFNGLVEKELTLGLDKPLHIFAIGMLTIICGLVAGSYPSFYLSSFNPVFVLKGLKIRAGSETLVRKGLVVVQFTVSIALIIGTLVIFRQVQHVKNRRLGFNKDNLLEMNVQGNMVKNFTSIRQDLFNTGLVENVALSDHPTLYGGNNTDGITWEGKAPNLHILTSTRAVSPEFFTTSGMEFLEGRDFRPNGAATDSLDVIITESMAKLMGNGSAVGKILNSDNESYNMRPYEVVGVVKDFVYGNMYGKADPVVFFCFPAYATVMYVRIKPTTASVVAENESGSGLEQALAKIEGVMKKDNAGYPFDYRFVDDEFNSQFMNEMLIGKLSRLFATLAIFISCLGLFGLAAHTAERRTKEIGIRKVLGASVPGIAGLLSKDFLKLIVLSAVIAFPLAWWFMNKWLQGYQYRITIDWTLFVLAGSLAIAIALITISFQAIRAALGNPVAALRSE